MLRVVLDSNCFIDATRSSAHAYAAMQCILGACSQGRLVALVSRHTLAELERKPDPALSLAKQFEVLPHFPIGTWKEQVASWNEVAGTWADARRNQQVQLELETHAKSGNDIRDRGAYLDALRARVDAFVTSDSQLADSSPAKRIEQRFGLRVVRPAQLATELSP